MKKNPNNLAQKDETIRLVLIDGCMTFREGMDNIIKDYKDLLVTGKASTISDVFSIGFKISADLAIVDANLPDGSGIEMCRWLSAQHPELRILLLCDRDWDIYLVAAQSLQLAGVILRNSAPADIIQSIRLAKKSSILRPTQLERITNWEHTVQPALRSLSSREWQVLWQIVAGMSNREIADQLKITENTIEKHISNILQKFKQPSRSALMVFIHSCHLEVFNPLEDSVRTALLAK